MVVTINTDASFNRRTREGGYAYWIKCNVGKITSYGSFKTKITSITVGELMAITKALHALSKSNWKDIKIIYINTDCLNAIHYMVDDQMAISRWKIRTAELDPIADLFHECKTRHFPLADIYFKHVKAHEEKLDTPRKFVNDWCDKAAKKGLQDKLNSLAKKEAGQ